MTDAPRYLQLRDFAKALNSDVVKKASARGGAIPWVKDYAGQLEDPEYVALTLSERAVLKDLRLLAARRGNKILFDEKYLRVQLRCTPRTQLVPKVSRLCSLGFLEDYNPATNAPANGDIPAHPILELGENGVSLEVEVEEKTPPTPPSAKGGKRALRAEQEAQQREQKRIETLRAFAARSAGDYPPDALHDELVNGYRCDPSLAVELVTAQIEDAGTLAEYLERHVDDDDARIEITDDWHDARRAQGLPT